MDGFYTPHELNAMGFKHVGENVLLSKKASFYGAQHMSFGDNVRIDDFCLFVGNITLGSHIHIGGFSGLHASAGSITIDDLTTFSSNVTVYAASDDYSGDSMTSAVVPDGFKHTQVSHIKVGKHCIIGTGSVLLPGSHLPEGVSVGAVSLVKTELHPWSIYAGAPVQKIRPRSQKLLTHVPVFLSSYNDDKK